MSDAANFDFYEGRGQSCLKHNFLQEYLEMAAHELIQCRSPAFDFVDAFAGPGHNADIEPLSDTSLALAIRTLEKVRRILESNGKGNLRVRFQLCERNPETFLRLQTFAAGNSEFDITRTRLADDHNTAPRSTTSGA